MDPLSPLLFVLFIEILSYWIQSKVEDGSWKEVHAYPIFSSQMTCCSWRLETTKWIARRLGSSTSALHQASKLISINH